MAKNKNRKQAASQSRSSQSEKSQEQAERSTTEAHQSPIPGTSGGSTGGARKQQKRFGHN